MISTNRATMISTRPTPPSDTDDPARASPDGSPGDTFERMSGHSTSARALLLVAALAAPLAAQERVAFRHLTIADGLSQNAVSGIVQDHRGFMWFGTKDGLDRYDGYQFVVFRHDPFDSTSISDSDSGLAHETAG